jgi:hypothetical protein
MSAFEARSGRDQHDELTFIGPVPALFQYAMHDQFVEVSGRQTLFRDEGQPGLGYDPTTKEQPN